MGPRRPNCHHPWIYGSDVGVLISLSLPGVSAVGHTRPGTSFRHLSEKEKDEDAKYTALDLGVLGRLEQVASIWGNFGECTCRSTQETRTLLRTTPMLAEYVVILLHLSTRMQQARL